MYRVSFIFILIALLCWFTGCVERYYPDEDNLKTGTLVINAHLTDQEGWQEIEISKSESLIHPKFNPVSGSFVELTREDGVTREFYEERAGYYRQELDADFLQTGLSFHIHVITPDGNEYESDFDRLRPVPPIDSMYYLSETNSYASENDKIKGVRFYIDFTYDDEAYEYVRWDLTETYEFHNPDMKAYFLDTDFRVKELPDTSNYKVCWISKELHSIHSMSMEHIDYGIYIKKPFSFVPNIQMEQKLHHKYSLLVRQYSIGEAAFYYWNELKKTTQEQGWLFDQQPALLESNICNINDPSERVLGFFSMSGVKEKRAFAENVPGLDTRPLKSYCMPVVKGPGGPPPFPPVYFAMAVFNGVSVYADVNKHCVDCRAYKNSTHIKPDYW